MDGKCTLRNRSKSNIIIEEEKTNMNFCDVKELCLLEEINLINVLASQVLILIIRIISLISANDK